MNTIRRHATRGHRIPSTIAIVAAVAASMHATTAALAGEARLLAFDLSLGVRTPLVSSSCLDDGVTVMTKKDARFVTIPFPAAPLYGLERDLILRSSTVRIDVAGREKAELIGIRSLPMRDGRPLSAGGARESVFVKVEIERNRSGELTVTAVNTRRPPDAKGPRSAARQTIARSDWLALVVEVPRDTTTIDVYLKGAASDRIDLEYLAGAAEVFRFSQRASLENTTVQRTLTMPGDSSGVMAALALARIASWRTDSTDRSAREIAQRFTTILAGGLTHADDRAVDTAWRGLVDGPVLTAAERSLLPAGRSGVAGRIAARATSDLPGSQRTRRVNILAMLNAAWRAADVGTCPALVDAVVADGYPDAFDALDGATAAGIDAMLTRIRTSKAERTRKQLVRALIGQSPLERHDELLTEARALKLEITSPDDPILKRFDQADDPRAKISILRALTVVPAVLVHHSEEFGRLIDAATGPRADASVREAAFVMSIAQARLRAAMEPAAYGAYPLGDARGLDAVSRGLIAALKGGASVETRIEAAAMLIRRGESAAVADALRGMRLSKDALADLLGRLAGRPGVARMDGWFALLSAAATTVERESAAAVWSALDAAATSYPDALAWRRVAAFKSAASYKRLAAIASDVRGDAGSAAAALKRLTESAHAGKSAGGWNASSRGREAAESLARLNRDVSNMVEGRYGSLIIVETIETIDPARLDGAPLTRWTAPRRTTLTGPIVLIQKQVDRFVIGAAGGTAGGGRPATVDAKLPDERLFPPALKPTTWHLPGVGDDREGAPAEFAPIALIGGTRMADGAIGAMNIDAAELVRSRAGVEDDADAEPIIAALPKSFVVSLHPAGFGTLAGVGPSEPPEAGSPGKPVFLNAMVVLEPMD